MEDGAAAGQGLAGWRWRGTLVLLAGAALLDLVLVASGGSPVRWLALAVFLAVAALAARGLRRGGAALFTAAAWAAGLSLLGTAALTVATALTALNTGFGIVEGVALTLLLVACWRRAAGRRQQVVTVAVALSVVVLPLRLGLIGDTALVVMAALVVTAVAVATGSALRATDASHHAAVSAVRRAEREEVARELHDVVAHHVTGMVVLTQAARTVAAGPAASPATSPAASSPAGGPAAGLDDALAAVERAGGEALVSLRSMVAVLRHPDGGPDGAPTEPTPTLGDLDDVVRRFRESGAAQRVEVALAPAAAALPPPVQAALHRVVQESLTNASRYARGASSVRVDLACDDGLTVLTVADSGGQAAAGAPGAGQDASWGGGFGIVGMRERVATLGGALAAGPGADGHGWTVRAEVPA